MTVFLIATAICLTCAVGLVFLFWPVRPLEPDEHSEVGDARG